MTICTKVVNKHHKLPFDVYIGRGSKWGNPFSHMEGTTAQYKVDSREEAIEKYREWVQTQPHLLDSLYELKGKTLSCYCKPKGCHGDILVEFADALPLRTLECSSKGDKRYSAFVAKVEVFQVNDSIEFHYQLAKRFNNITNPNVNDTWDNKMKYLKSVKGKRPDYIVIGHNEYDLKYLSQFYDLLWLKYLDENKGLVEYASGFDDYTDMFKGKSINCQADTIRKYIKQGREVILEECSELMEIMRKNK